MRTLNKLHSNFYNLQEMELSGSRLVILCLQEMFLKHTAMCSV